MQTKIIKKISLKWKVKEFSGEKNYFQYATLAPPLPSGLIPCEGVVCSMVQLGGRYIKGKFEF